MNIASKSISNSDNLDTPSFSAKIGNDTEAINLKNPSQPKQQNYHSSFTSNTMDIIVPVSVSETPMIVKNRVLRGDVIRNTRVNSESKQHESSQIISSNTSVAGRRRSSIGMRGKRVSTSSNGLCRKFLCFCFIVVVFF